MRRARASLIASVVIGLLAVTTAGVSTYAWFKASSNTTIDSRIADTTTISTTKPNEYSFYSYKGNKAAHTYTGTFTSDFDAITSSNISELTNLGELYPTKAATFAIKMTGCTNGQPITLNLTKVTSNTINKQNGSKHRYIRSSSKEINVGWAIDIYTKCVATANSNYNDLINSTSTLSAGDKFTCTSSNDTTYLAASSTTNNVITLSSPKPLYNSNATATTMYLFYTIYFSNASSTWYKEVDGSGNALKEDGTSNTRYFDIDTSNGNSNCFAGLNFALNELSLSF